MCPSHESHILVATIADEVAGLLTLTVSAALRYRPRPPRPDHSIGTAGSARHCSTHRAHVFCDEQFTDADTMTQVRASH
jgi:hypothetical protein